MRFGSIGRITGISLPKRRKRCLTQLTAPLLLGLPPDSRRHRVLDFDAVKRAEPFAFGHWGLGTLRWFLWWRRQGHPVSGFLHGPLNPHRDTYYAIRRISQ